jgi:hypothetical protein
MTIRIRGVSGIRGAAQVPPPPPVEGDFQGNPNFFASSIDVSGGIYNSRKIGISSTGDGTTLSTPSTPAWVHVSAKKMLASGVFKDTAGNTLTQFTVRPWEDLEFRWDFGDPGSTETFTRPTDGATVNSNIQVGPDAVHCYRTAGDKTITLTVRARNSDGTGFVTAQAQDSITIADYNTLYPSTPIHYFDSAYASENGAPNGTQSRPWNTFAKLRELCVALANQSGLDLRLKRGSVFATTNDPAWPMGSNNFCRNFRFSAYGSGAQPIIRKTAHSSNRNGLWLMAGRNNVVSNIDFELYHNGLQLSGVSSLLTSPAISLPPGTPSTSTFDEYFDNCNLRMYDCDHSSFFYMAGEDTPRTLDGEVCPHEGNITNKGFWNCNAQMMNDAVAYGSGNQVFMACGKFWFMYGGTWGGGSVGQANYEHEVYANVWRHSLYKWMNFHPMGNGNPDPNFNGRGNAINVNWDVDSTQGDDLTCQYVMVSECNFPGNSCNTAFENGDGSSPAANAQYYNSVAEKCAFSSFDLQRAISTLRSRSFTLRDNRSWDLKVLLFLAEQSTENGIYYCYRNKIDIPATGIGTGIDYRIISSVPFQHTDNIIRSIRSSGKNFYGFGWTSMATKFPLIDRNGYSPGTSGQQLFSDEESPTKTFAQLQAAGYEPNSTIGSDPGWPSPVTQWSDMGASPT